MANGYLTVEGQRPRYFRPRSSVPFTLGRTISNLDSDIFWQSVIDRHVIARPLAVRPGPDAFGPQLRRLISGYVAGYNRYLASVGGPQGVPDPTRRRKPLGQADHGSVGRGDADLMVGACRRMPGPQAIGTACRVSISWAIRCWSLGRVHVPPASRVTSLSGGTRLVGCVGLNRGCFRPLPVHF